MLTKSLTRAFGTLSKRNKQCLTVSNRLFSQQQHSDWSQNTYEFDGGYCHSPNKHKIPIPNRFKDKVVITTGAAGNFGEAFARRVAAEGGRLAVCDINSNISETANTLRNDFKNCEIRDYTFDITNETAVTDAIQQIYKEFGRIDGLFNNAGYQGDFTQIDKYSASDFARVLEINVNGVFMVLKATANVMQIQNPNGGSIVNTASMAAHSGPPNMPAYGTSKAAVLHMTKIAAKDLVVHNIRVNSISPAFIGPGFMWKRQIELQAEADSQYYDSDPNIVAQQMISGTPMRRYGSIDEVMGPATFLLSDDASYLTGIDIQVTGGMN